MFVISKEPIPASQLTQRLEDPAAGARSIFEGRVRNRADGREVTSLTYEAYEALAVKEGNRILAEARDRFDVVHVACVHRVGHLQIGECAVWVGVAAAHREAAFGACHYIVEELKNRVPIWKKETYAQGDPVWVRAISSEPAPT